MESGQLPLPIIAIVGRPNVGKSTLFNRLAGRRIAIVSDTPGTTRDRVSIDAEWGGRRFIVVDTGGIEDRPAASVEGTPAQIWEHVREQTRRALEQADGVILVVDGMTGLTPHDRDAADMVRRAAKPSALAVNKTETVARAHAAAEFYELGAGTPFPVSAYHGGGIDDLLRELFSKVPVQEEEAQPGHTPRVAIVGRPNVGKSALFNALVGEDRAIVSPVPGTTRDAIDTRATFNGRELTFIDTAGLRRRGKIEEDLEKYGALRTVQSIERCHVAVIVLDASEFPTEQDTHVGGFADDAGRGVVIVVNKWDLAPQMRLTEGAAAEIVRGRFKFFSGVPVLFTSALQGRGVDKVPAVVLMVYDEFTRQFSQDELNLALTDAVARRAPPSKGGRRVSISQITQTRTGPPTLTLSANYPELIHFSYRRYLENRLREAFGFTGSPLRLQFTAGHG